MPCTTDLALLVEMLGEAGSQRFLANNLPQLRQYHHEILRCLYEQNWEGAAVLGSRPPFKWNSTSLWFSGFNTGYRHHSIPFFSFDR